MRHFTIRQSWLAGALLLLVLSVTSFGVLGAAPTGGFAVVLDQSTNFGDSPKSLVYYDVDNLTKPLFAVFLGADAPNGSGGFFMKDVESVTVNPDTGDTYVLAFGHGTPSDPQTTIVDYNGRVDGTGDYDLFRVDFQAAYNDWQTNHLNTYVTYGDGGVFSPLHTNPQASPVVVKKIGEVGRNPSLGTNTFSSQLEFINPGKLFSISSQLSTLGGADDVQYRSIDRVSLSPGAAVSADSGRQGGFNHGTTESWESKSVGNVNLDPDTSEMLGLAAVRNRNGITGSWVAESDATNDEIAFFDLATQSYRSINFPSGPTQSFRVDIDPVANDNLGNLDKFFVDPTNGDLVIVENGFFDSPQHQPSVYKVKIGTYDDGAGQITVSGFSSVSTLNASVYDDGTALIDGRYSFYDWVNNSVYFFDEDGPNDVLNGGVAFGHDWYRLNLTTGLTTIEGPDADFSNGLFDISTRANDQVEFFHLSVPEPSTGVMLIGFIAAGTMIRRKQS